MLERACERHGGWQTWQRSWRVSLHIESFASPLLRLKGLGRTFSAPGGRVEIFPHEQKTVFHDYPDKNHVGIFERGAVRLDATSDRHVVAESTRHRDTFQQRGIRDRWSALDAVYFFGYALWHYHSLPFTLGPARLVSHRQTRERGAAGCDVLGLELPADVPTHSRRQVFYFDPSGLLVRHDYVAEPIGGWTRGAHYWEDYRQASGVPIAMRRRVVARIGRTALPFVVLSATFSNVRWTSGGDAGRWKALLVSKT